MSLKQRKRNIVILGAIILIIVVIILLVSPALFLSPTVTFIDTELNKASQNRVPVQTRTDFGSSETVASFPYQFGKWQGSDYDVTKYVELLGANLILLRGYMPNTFTQPVFILPKSVSQVRDMKFRKREMKESRLMMLPGYKALQLHQYLLKNWSSPNRPETAS